MAGDVSAYIGTRTYHLVVRKPGEISPTWTLFFPFDRWTWGLLGASLAAICLCLLALYLDLVPVAPGSLSEVNLFSVFSVSAATLLSESVPLYLFDHRKFSKYVCEQFIACLFLANH